VQVLRTSDLEMRLGGLLQLQAALWTGSQALLENDDQASQPGLRLRRVRLGVEGHFKNRLGVLLVLNPLESDKEVGTIADAKLTYEFAPWLALSAGVSKVPFARESLVSSKRLLLIERPLSVNQMTPTRRLGVSADGMIWDGRLAYLVSVMNGTEGFTAGNQFGGVLVGARVEFSPLGRPVVGGRAGSISIGVSGIHEEGPSARRDALTADLLATFRGASLLLEGLYDRRAPTNAPAVSPDIAATIQRLGVYAEAGYAFQVFTVPVQLVARVERYDDNLALFDSGDTLSYAGGVNVEIIPEHVRAQLEYIGRYERAGPQIDNDAVLLQLQGAF
jgi:hypothetical protein